MGRATAAVFTADPEGFREQNAGREPAALVKELVQNALDEAVTRLDVRVGPARRGLVIEVEDDLAGGIRRPELVFTLFGSDKRDSPHKRGRMGRGLKEMLSVADRSLVVSEHGAFAFTRTRYGRWERHTESMRRACGTLVRCEVEAWTAQDGHDVIAFLRRMRPPEGVRLVVDGAELARTTATSVLELELPTVVYERVRGERVARERRGRCAVELIPASEPWIYEMGIPVEPTSFDRSIDVGQRVPLRDRRDTIPESYRRELFGAILSATADELTDEQARADWVLAGARSAALGEGAKQRLVRAYTGGYAYAADATTLHAASAHHLQVVSLRAIPEAIRPLVRELAADAREVLRSMVTVPCPVVPATAQNAAERGTVAVFEAIARGIGGAARVLIREGRPSNAADFDRGEISLYRQKLGAAFFDDPLGERALALLIHELAHWAPADDAHGLDFKTDIERVAGAVAAYCARHGAELAALTVSISGEELALAR